MANALLAEQPPAPDAGTTNALQSAPAPQPQAMTAPGAAPQQPPAPPTHEQVVAGLRHFDAVKREIKIILADPALGKSSMKSKIIDGVTRLVADGMMQPADAVTELSKVPTEPLLQMRWAQTMLAQTQQAERGILAHHAIGFAGQGSMPTPSGDGHLDHLGAMAANYGPKSSG